MVQIHEENSEPLNNGLINPILVQKRKTIRLTTFTSSVSLILSWPFPIIILCFQANQRLIFDPRIYAAFIMAYLLSGSVKRLLLQRFLRPTFFNAIIPTLLGLIGNGVFMAALYKSNNWNWMATFFMFISRLCFGWATYSAEDYNRRAKQAALSKQELGRVKRRVTDMVPDFQDSAFHAGVVVAVAISFILEVCLRFAGPQMSEFYSILILSGFSTALSFVCAPSMHAAVGSLLNVPIEQSGNEQNTSNSRMQPPTSNREQNRSRDILGRNRLVSHALMIRHKYLVGTIVASLRHNQQPPGQLIMILFSAFLTTATILFDHLLLPYFVVYTRKDLFVTSDYFPFPEFLFVYAILFSSEALLCALILDFTSFGSKAMAWSTSGLIGALATVSTLASFMPAFLCIAGSLTTGYSNSLFGFCLFVVCVAQGLLKAAHCLLVGILFTKYSDSMLGSVAETGEQLLGILRCFFAALLFIVGGAVLYHQRFMVTITMVSIVYSLATPIAIVGFVQVYILEKALQVRIEPQD